MPSIINATTTAGVAVTGDNSGALALQTNNGTTAVTINTFQGVSVLNCLGVGNATPSTSGAGITFPATQSASTDANTLDDYEEGTWTPTVGGSATYNVNGQTGIYTKIGNACTVHFRISINNLGSGSGTTLSGLPFASASNGALDVYTGRLSYFNNLATTVVYMSLYVNQGASTCRFPLMTAANNITADNTSMFTNGTTIYGSVTYMTA